MEDRRWSAVEERRVGRRIARMGDGEPELAGEFDGAAGDLETRAAEVAGSPESRSSRRGDGAESPDIGRRCRVAGEVPRRRRAAVRRSRGERSCGGFVTFL